MNRLRSIWGMRSVAGLLMVSLLPVTFATAVHAAQHTSSYADWVRLQLRIPAGEVDRHASLAMICCFEMVSYAPSFHCVISSRRLRSRSGTVASAAG